VGSRRNLLRLEALGEGNFGEVFKASYVAARGHGHVPVLVAVKTLKTPDSTARGELLREAALMTLFEHSNLVAAIGKMINLLAQSFQSPHDDDAVR
jgi:hypothetical protein